MRRHDGRQWGSLKMNSSYALGYLLGQLFGLCLVVALITTVVRKCWNGGKPREGTPIADFFLKDRDARDFLLKDRRR
jgi:hypothetical protein